MSIYHHGSLGCWSPVSARPDLTRPCPPPSPRPRPRPPRCGRCRNHGLAVPLKGHARRCPFSACVCFKCNLATQRARIGALVRHMAATPPRRRRPTEETTTITTIITTTTKPGPAPPPPPGLSPPGPPSGPGEDGGMGGRDRGPVPVAVDTYTEEDGVLNLSTTRSKLFVCLFVCLLPTHCYICLC